MTNRRSVKSSLKAGRGRACVKRRRCRPNHERADVVVLGPGPGPGAGTDAKRRGRAGGGADDGRRAGGCENRRRAASGTTWVCDGPRSAAGDGGSRRRVQRERGLLLAHGDAKTVFDVLGDHRARGDH